MALTYREVQGYFTARIPDSGDADLNPDTVPLYQNTGQSTGTVAAHGDGNSWDDRPPIAVA